MDKKVIVQKIIAALQNQLDAYTRAAHDAHAAATDPGSKAENKYDTRSLEASYLARGQALRVAEAEQALSDFSAPLLLIDHHGKSAVLGSLVMLESMQEQSLYFIGPSAGGLEVQSEGYQVLVITPSSPMGKQLLGKKQGEQFQLKTGAQLATALVCLVQ
ncbi:GreA/GreB family elongation factor [soil metagenome]